MTLDLEKGGVGGRGLLSSPDLHMLKLASPELERFIMNQQPLLKHEEPPPHYVLEDALASLYPQEYCSKNAPQDQYGSKNGLIHQDYLTNKEQICSKDGMIQQDYLPSKEQYGSRNGLIQQDYLTSKEQICPKDGLIQQDYLTKDQYCSKNGSPDDQYCSSKDNGQQEYLIKSESEQYWDNTPYWDPLVSVKEEPIDLAAQERLKLERKRLRNRIAASKCRRRKLERIARLEDRVAALKAENADLAAHVARLRGAVARLKETVMTHARAGCALHEPHLLMT